MLPRPPNPGMVSPVPSSTKRESMGADRMKPEKNNMEGAIGEWNIFPLQLQDKQGNLFCSLLE